MRLRLPVWPIVQVIQCSTSPRRKSSKSNNMPIKMQNDCGKYKVGWYKLRHYKLLHLLRLLSSSIWSAFFNRMDFQFFIWLGWTWCSSASSTRLLLPLMKSCTILALNEPLYVLRFFFTFKNRLASSVNLLRSVTYRFTQIKLILCTFHFKWTHFSTGINYQCSIIGGKYFPPLDKITHHILKYHINTPQNIMFFYKSSLNYRLYCGRILPCYHHICLGASIIIQWLLSFSLIK